MTPDEYAAESNKPKLSLAPRRPKPFPTVPTNGNEQAGEAGDPLNDTETQIGSESALPLLIAEPKPDDSSALTFPDVAYVGVAAKIADLYAREHEAAKEFVYMDLLTLIGSVLSGRWKLILWTERLNRPTR